MAIGNIETEADLERFLNDRLDNLLPANVQGLSDIIAQVQALGVERFGSAEAVEGATTEEPVPGCTYTAPANLKALAIGIFDAEYALQIGELTVDGVAQPGQILARPAAGGRGTYSQAWALEINAGQVVNLTRTALEGIIYGGHTALVIARIG